MKEPNFKSEDEKLGAVVRESRTTPSLPPHFQENVWRRIESAEARNVAVENGNWLDAITAWMFRPGLAFAVAAVLVLTGLGLGWSNGEQRARQDAQARYVATVAPNVLR